MRFTAIFLTGALAAFATAETTTSALSPQTSAQVAIVKCLEACALGDVNCQSKCIAVPNPNASQVNETNKCVAACPQGDGSAADTKAYGKCTKDCIDKYYFNPTTGTPATTSDAPGSNGGSNNNGGDSNSDSGDDSNGAPSGTQGVQASGSGTGTAAAPTKTGNAAAGMVNVAGGGLLALFLGVLAL